jgi:serine/threonine protein kinase
VGNTGSDCLDDNVLQEYFGGLLDTESRLGVQAHLDGCAYCQSILRGIVQAEQADPSPETMVVHPAVDVPSSVGPITGVEVTSSVGSGISGHDSIADEGEDDALIGSAIGNYVIQSQIGKGGMGRVYLAENAQIGRKVAIKVLSEIARREEMSGPRFIAEAKAATTIRHPSIIDVYDFGCLPDGRFYSVMEYIEGYSLKQIIDDYAPMSEADAFGYIGPICEGLIAAHGHGIVHRDLKPDNILVSKQEPHEVKILDFGLAKLLAPEPGDISLTATGTFMGTPLFVSPEQAAGERDQISPAADLYSIAVIFYWMLSGLPPLWDRNVHILITKHMMEIPKPLREVASDVSESVANVIDQCLAKKPTDRPTSAEAILAAFHQSLGHDASIAARHNILPKAKRARKGAEAPWNGSGGMSTLGQAAGEISSLETNSSSRKWRTPALFGGMVVVALAVGLSFYGGRSTEKSASTPTLPPKVVTKRPKKKTMVAKPKVATLVSRKVRVVSQDKQLACQYRIGEGKLEARDAPCTIEVSDGATLDLTLVRAGYRSFNKKWSITADKVLDIETIAQSKLIVLTAIDGLKVDLPMPKPAGIAKAKRRSTRRPAKRATKKAPSPVKPDPVPAQKEPVEPVKTKKKMGDGIF